MKPGKLAQAAAYYRAHDNVEAAEDLEDLLVTAGRCRRCGRLLSDLQKRGRLDRP